MDLEAAHKAAWKEGFGVDPGPPGLYVDGGFLRGRRREGAS